MKNISIEIKWAVLFLIMTLLWMVLEKLCGLHGKYIDYHLYLTNLFAIPAIWFMVLALREKKEKFLCWTDELQAGINFGYHTFRFHCLIKSAHPMDYFLCYHTRILPEHDKTFCRNRLLQNDS